MYGPDWIIYLNNPNYSYIWNNSYDSYHSYNSQNSNNSCNSYCILPNTILPLSNNSCN